MGRTPTSSMSELIKAAEDFYEKKKYWPTVENLRDLKPSSTERLARAIRKAKQIRSDNTPARFFNALAYLAGYPSPQEAKKEIKRLEKANPNRLTKKELRALLALLDPYSDHPPLEKLTKQKIKDLLPYSPHKRFAAQELANVTGLEELENGWTEIENTLRTPPKKRKA